ncbi:hypothetical protein MesoLj113c_09320 [Mesorhizobium sp. 113-3-9]|nr:hypothetical protein MesoLj113c_09320 [Mesorhizobium sp. 113-3-9]
MFEGKYSILIDMRELEATMSGHPTTMIARGMHRLSAARASARDTTGPTGAIRRFGAVDVHFCALNGTKA